MNTAMSRPVRQLAAVGLALGVVLMAVNLTVIPASDFFTDLQTRIESRRLEIIRAKRLEASASAARSDGPYLPAGATLFLSGETEAIQSATLQAELKRIAAEVGVKIQSAAAVPSPPREGFAFAAVQLSLRAPIAAVYELLQQTEALEPPALVDMVEIKPVLDVVRPEDARQLDVEILVRGFLRREAARQ